MVLYSTCELFADQKFKMAAMTKHSLTLDPMGISHFLYQICEIGADRKFNMAARTNYEV